MTSLPPEELAAIMAEKTPASSSDAREAGGLSVKLVPESRLADISSAAAYPVAAIRYAGAACPGPALPCATVRVPMRQFSGERPAEVWTSATPVTRRSFGPIEMCANAQAAFGIFASGEPAGSSLQSLSEEAYARIFRATSEAGFPHLVRMWNYVCDINRNQDGLERYRSFCLGRYAAYAAHFAEFESSLPAGSCVGTAEPGLIVCFIASRTPATPVQNPRQLNAFHYPRRYGPRSPLFSRAMVVERGTGCDFFSSGTASIVDHESRHAGDAKCQLEESLRNHRALLSHAGKVTGRSFRESGEDALYKAYIRKPEDFPAVRRLLESELGDETCVLYLGGDLCRSELLLEIEAVVRDPA